MGSGVGIAWVAAIGLLVAAVMRARAIANLMPLLEAAARAHQARIHQSFLGMPQITKFHSGHAMRMTLMRVSTSSPEGGGEMTCVDFDWPAPHVGEFRVRERVDARRNAVPVALMGGARPFTLGSPEVDARYLVVGTDPVASLGILGDARVVESIMALPHGADVQVRGTRCCVAVKGYPSELGQVDRLFATAEHLLDAAMKVLSESR